MADTISTLAAKLRPHWLRDDANITTTAAGGVTGVTDHGALSGLFDDDHPQYLTPVRGDARYLAASRQIIAGNGLTGGGALTADVTIDVGVSGLGLGVGADAVTLTSSSSPGAAAAVLATTAGGLLTLYNGAFTQAAGSEATFASGFAGSGWRADYGVTTASRATIETDDLTVRGRMRIYELLIQQIRATNGSLLVTSSSKVVTVSGTSNPNWTVNGVQLTLNGANATLTCTIYTITTATSGEDAASKRTYHGFLFGDVIRAQRVEWNGSVFGGVIQSDIEVTSVTNLYTYGAAFVSGDQPAIGYDYVRLGNWYDSSRRGVVYLTSDDSNAPFIDIADNISYHSDWNTAGAIKARLGRLSGISDAAFGGTLSGYGLYSNNVYLRGQIVVTGGDLGGLAATDVNANTTTIDGGKITANSVTASQIAASTITANLLSVSTLSAITADMGSLTAGSIVIGSTNKLWLNESADGALNIGGSTKASAPFRVTAAGALTATSATITGAITASSGGISGNFYVGSDVGTSGNLYVGSNADIRMSGDGIRLVMADLGSSPTIPTNSSALRWFPSISATHDSTKDYSGIIGYRHTGQSIVDNIWTSYVGSAHYTTYSARVILQSGNYDGGTYRDARLEVIKDPGANTTGSVYCAATYTNIDGMLGLYPKTAGSLMNGMCHVYQSPSHNFVIAYYNGTTTKFRYFNLTTTAAPVWQYSTSAPA